MKRIPEGRLNEETPLPIDVGATGPGGWDLDYRPLAVNNKTAPDWRMSRGHNPDSAICSKCC